MKNRWLDFRKRYWDARAERERRALALGALVLAPLLTYFLLWQPAHVANARLRAGVPLLRAQAAQVRAQAAEVEELRHRPRPAVLDAVTLKAAIEDSAVRHQLREAVTALDAQPPNAVRITIAALAFEQWVRWLRDLQQQQHIRAESVGIVALPQPGMVRISATLSNGTSQ